MYRFGPETMAEDEKYSVEDEQDVHEHEQVMSVPKGVESRDVLEGPRQLD